MHDAHAIDMHDHLIAPAVADFLAREGEKHATRLVAHDGQRYFVMQDAARRLLRLTREPDKHIVRFSFGTRIALSP
jgi:hypothetical protein